MKESYNQRPSEKEVKRDIFKEKLSEYDSLEDFVLRELNSNSLEDLVYTNYRFEENKKQIPLFAAKDIVVVDSIETSLENKLKLIGYRFWHKEPDYELGNYSLVKNLLPEGLVRVDDTVDDVLNNDELVQIYESLDNVDQLTNKFIKPGKKYFSRFKSGVKIISKLIDYGLDDSRILELEESLNKYTYKTVNSNFQKFDDENLNEVEMLHNLGFLYKEIQGMLGLTEHETLKYLRALYYLKRATPAKDQLKRSNKRRKMIREIENLRQQNTNISAEEISIKLNITVDMAKQGIQTLIVLGRTKPIDKSYYMRKMHNTDLVKEDLRKILRNYLKEYPNHPISYKQIHQDFPYEISDYLITQLYKEISQEEFVPRTRTGASRAAEELIINLFKQNPEKPISIYQLSKQYKISYDAIKRGYNSARVKSSAPPLIERGYNPKKEKAIEIFVSNSNLGSLDYIDISLLAKELKVKRSTLEKWYREASRKENLLPTKRYFYRDRRREVLGYLKKFRNKYPDKHINLSELARGLGVEPDAVRRWYRELAKVENLPPTRLYNSIVTNRS